jgi:hypothetical protein
VEGSQATTKVRAPGRLPLPFEGLTRLRAPRADRTGAPEALERRLEPAVAALEAHGHRRFVVAALVACCLALGAVFTLNVLVDPFSLSGSGLLPPALETDRTIKLNLIQKLRSSPDIVILGSSRARQAEPSYLKRITGHSAFDAAVTGGTAADAYMMARYVTDRFPGHEHRYIWFVDSGIATNGVNPQLWEDPRGARYLSGKGLHLTLRDVGTYIGTQATAASWRVVQACVFGSCRGRIQYLPDGSIARRTLRYLPERSGSLKKSVDALVAAVVTHPLRKANTNPIRYAYFERALAFMNAHGVRPVIVLNPIHPRVWAQLRKQGFVKRKAGLAYLHDLHKRFDFVVVDCQDIRRWGGSARDFTNATHVNRWNMRLMLRYIVAHSDGALG